MNHFFRICSICAVVSAFACMQKKDSDEVTLGSFYGSLVSALERIKTEFGKYPDQLNQVQLPVEGVQYNVSEDRQSYTLTADKKGRICRFTTNTSKWLCE